MSNEYKQGWNDAYQTIINIVELTDVLDSVSLKQKELLYRAFCRAGFNQNVYLDAPSYLSDEGKWLFHKSICSSTNPNPNLVRDCSNSETGVCLIGERLYKKWKNKQ